jgi:hypothetical protein
VPRDCVFCGGSANSNEHAFPRWLADLVPGEAPLTMRRSGKRPASWESSGLDVRVKQVCRECNNTWMSELETRSRPLVSELATDARTAPLSHAEQITLSAWLYKTAIMLALAYPAEDRFVLPGDYHYFYEHRRPPHGTTIWIAALVQTEEELRIGWTQPERLDFTREADGTAIEPPGYRLSLSVLALLCQIVHDPHGGSFARPREYRDVWTRVMPISKGEWPPGRHIASSEIEDVARGRIFSGPEPS